MGPQNGLVGDALGTELPRMIVPEQELVEEKKMAKFSKTAEFQRLKQHLEERIAFYQSYLPNGDPVAAEKIPMAELGHKWVVANAIVTEFKGVLAAYQQAREVVEEDERRKNT